MNRRWRAALVAVLLGSMLTGCGIPDQTDVRVDGRGPAPFSATGAGSGSGPPKRLDSGDDAETFAANFLRAAAGESSGAVDRVKEYIAPGVPEPRDKPGIEVPINVVRLRGDKPKVSYNTTTRNHDVQIDVQQVGVLRADGSLAPPVATATQYRFTVGAYQSEGADRAERGLFVLDPPNVLLMSTDALRNYYHQWTVYFWNADHTALIPDLRYLPAAVPPESQATEVLGRWLAAGPADWLKSTVVALPGGAQVIGNVPRRGDRIEVNLSQVGGDNQDRALDLLATQIAWSMPELTGTLELKIQNQSRRTVDLAQHREQHPVYRATGAPRQFCVYAGAIHALNPPQLAGRRTAPAVAVDPNLAQVPIDERFNENIVTAGLARYPDRVAAALVTRSANRLSMLVGVGSGVVREFRRSASFESVGRPVWIRSEPQRPVGLVIADGRLYRFEADASMAEVKVPDAAGPISAVSVALDGHRMAFVARGRLYVATLTVDGASVTAGPPRRLVTSLSGLSTVEWIDEDALAVAGVRDAEGAIYQISVDGAVESPIVTRSDRAARASVISAYPGSDDRWPGAGRLIYESGGQMWDTLLADPIGREQVVGAGLAATSDGPTAPFLLY